MSGDEAVVFMLSVGAGPLALAFWFYRLAAVQSFGVRRAPLGPLVLAVVACATVLAVVLTTLAAPDVRNDPKYLALYFFLGLAWLRLSEFTFALAGVSGRDDVIERRNGAAVPVVAGAMLGVTCGYAGGNIGAGPGWWVVVFSAGLATLGLAGVWFFLDRMTHAADRVTVDRDFGAGTRLGALLLACGAILGRAVAGDWSSVEATVRDFVLVGWPVVALAGLAIAVERGAAPVFIVPGQRVGSTPALPAAGYLLAAALYIFYLGWPV